MSVSVASIEELSGIRIAGQELARVFAEFRSFLALCAGWALLSLLALLGTALAFSFSAGFPFGFITFEINFGRLVDGDLMRLYYLINTPIMTVGGLRLAIGWTRLILLNKKPRGFLRIPRGALSYLYRSIVLWLLYFVLMIPAIAVWAVRNSISPSEDVRTLVLFGMFVVNSSVVLYVLARTWLVFPAIALGEEPIDFSESAELMKGGVRILLLGSALPYLVFVLASAVLYAFEASPAFGYMGFARQVFLELTGAVFSFAASAACVGATAVEYRSRVKGPTSAGVATVFD